MKTLPFLGCMLLALFWDTTSGRSSESDADVPFHCADEQTLKRCIQDFRASVLRDRWPVSGIQPSTVAGRLLRRAIDEATSGRTLEEVRFNAPRTQTSFFGFFKYNWVESKQSDGFPYMDFSNHISLSMMWITDPIVAEALRDVVIIWHGYEPYQTLMRTIEMNATCPGLARAVEFLNYALEEPSIGDGVTLRADLELTRDRIFGQMGELHCG